MSPPVVVIGAGPAGLSAAYHLECDDYLVLEAEPVPGGLCRSFEFGGAVFDLGGHAFFTRHEEVRNLVGRMCPTELFEQPRQAWVYSHGTYVRYPFQSHLHGLPTAVIRDCLVGLMNVSRDSDTPPASLADWITRTFGDGIRQHFLGPYNAKLWGYPLDQIAPAWTSERIVTPDVADIVVGALEARHQDDYVNARVTYPADGGFSGLYQGFVDHVGNRLRCGVRVDSVTLAARTARSSDGEEFPFEQLISTMPLDQLAARITDLPSCCADIARDLRHNSLHLVNMAVDAEGMTDMQRVYVADPSVPFHKLVLNSNSSPALRARQRFGIQAEVSFSPHKHVSLDDLAGRVVDAVVEMGIVSRAAVREVQTRTVEYAYPVYTGATAAGRDHIVSTLREAGVLCAGRFAEWLYINSDDAVRRGQLAAAAAGARSG
jgi:UDP-galactopyranose mutase